MEAVAHEVHVGSYVGKEFAIALAEVIEAGLPVGSGGKTIFRALPVAGEVPATLAALLREALCLYSPEGKLLI